MSFVVIRNKWTGVPAIILETPTGGVLSNQGISRLDDQARLNVYIDISQQWDIKVLDNQPLPYNILDPKQSISLSDFTNIVPEIGKTYVLNTPPYTEYTWDGERLISSLGSFERNFVASMVSSTPTTMTMSGGKLSTYNRAGIQHLVSYPDANTVIITNTTGETRTIILDNAGLVLSIV